MTPEDFAYVQVSLDGGSAASHDAVRGAGTFDAALATTAELTERGFDTRIIFTVSQANRADALQLLDLADELGVSLVKYHVFDLFTGALTRSACGGCKSAACLGGCPAERVVTGASSCEAYPDIVPVCRLWKSSAKAEG